MGDGLGRGGAGSGGAWTTLGCWLGLLRHAGPEFGLGRDVLRVAVPVDAPGEGKDEQHVGQDRQQESAYGGRLRWRREIEAIGAVVHGSCLAGQFHRQADALHAGSLQVVHDLHHAFVFHVAIGADHHGAGTCRPAGLGLFHGGDNAIQ